MEKLELTACCTKLAVFASVAYDAVPNNDPVNPPVTSILPVITIDPEINIDPVNSNVSALISNTTLPVLLLLKLIDPVKTREPDITTA